MSANLRIVGTEETLRGDAISGSIARCRTSSSKRTMLSSLRAVVRALTGLPSNVTVDLAAFPWELLADAQFFAVSRQKVFDRYGETVSAKYVTAMRSLLRSLCMVGLVDSEDMLAVVEATKQRSARGSLPPPLHFDASDIERVLRACRKDPNPLRGARDIALILMTASTGARRSEITGVALGDLDFHRGTLQLRTKGGGSREALVHGAALQHVSLWLGYRGSGPGPLFNALQKGGKVLEHGISDHQFWKLLRERSAMAQVEPVILPHDLRRWLVTSLLDEGNDIFTVARIVGHRSVQSTMRYDRRSLTRLRGVVDGLALPALVDLEAPDRGVG